MKTLRTTIPRPAILSSLILIAGVSAASPALAQSPTHAYINSMRSSYETHYFVSIGATGSAGTITSQERGEDAESLSSRWQGYGVRNEVGIEFLKFLHFSVAHSSLNIRSSTRSSETLSGSRFEGAASLNFYAPLGNLQMGGGFLGSRLDYRRESDSGSYFGSGYFYNVGYNYFMSSMISFYIDARKSQENLVNNNSSELPGNLKTDMSEAGLGFKIWF
jgi:hypothetical protein